MTSTSGAETTQDAFLGGRLSILQPAKGYRAGVDPVLLAASVPAKPTDAVLELGCGVGVASLCLASRTGAQLIGLELQPEYAALARENANANGLRLDVVDGDLRRMPQALRQQSFDHVMANPPYYDRARGTAAPDAGREASLGGGAVLADWIDAGVRRLKPRGWLTVILKADRVTDVIAALDKRVGDVTLLPIVPRQGRAAELLILRARKGARGASKVLFPLVLHQGAMHQGDGDSYTPRAAAILRGGAELRL